MAAGRHPAVAPARQSARGRWRHQTGPGRPRLLHVPQCRLRGRPTGRRGGRARAAAHGGAGLRSLRGGAGRRGPDGRAARSGPQPRGGPPGPRGRDVPLGPAVRGRSAGRCAAAVPRCLRAASARARAVLQGRRHPRDAPPREEQPAGRGGHDAHAVAPRRQPGGTARAVGGHATARGRLGGA